MGTPPNIRARSFPGWVGADRASVEAHFPEWGPRIASGTIDPPQGRAEEEAAGVTVAGTLFGNLYQECHLRAETRGRRFIPDSLAWHVGHPRHSDFYLCLRRRVTALMRYGLIFPVGKCARLAGTQPAPLFACRKISNEEPTSGRASMSCLKMLVFVLFCGTS